MSRFKGFTRVASSYEPGEARLAVTALEGAGFHPITTGMQTTDTLPMNSLAFGPIEVMVPDADADEAAALLEAIANGTVINHAPLYANGVEPDDPQVEEDSPRKGWLAHILGFLVAGVSSPLKGLSVDRKTK